MHNIAHFDAKLQQRDITAMAHGSKLDAQIYSEFSSNWTELTYQAQLIKAKMQNIEIHEVIDMGDIDMIPPGEYRNS